MTMLKSGPWLLAASTVTGIEKWALKREVVFAHRGCMWKALLEHGQGCTNGR